MSEDLFGVKFVVLDNVPINEALLVSGLKMTHTENMTNGEKKKVIEFIDTVRLDNIKAAPTQEQKDGKT